MATLFSSITVRENGQKILYSWFNALRSAGVSLESFLGAGYIAETSATIANGQASATNVTGLLVSSASYKSAIVFAEVRRKTSTNELVSVGLLKLYYRDLDSAWYLVDELSGDEDNVEFSITTGGQVQYTSGSIAGSSYSGTIKFRLMSTSA